jgi:DNA-binding NtrC family response regulator
LEEHDGSVCEVARRLGRCRQRIYQLIDELGIDLREVKEKARQKRRAVLPNFLG